MEWWFQGLRREENVKLVFNRYRVSAGEDEKVLEMEMVVMFGQQYVCS